MDEGFLHDPLADIAALRDVLESGYDQQSILKELMQNADDSGSTCLHLCWHPGWHDHAHPLLQGPVLLVLNDGKFDTTDARAIRYLRLGSKGADTRAIGRFGLGLKSIFRWCEALFYMASPDQKGTTSPFYRNLLNPWGNSGLHDDWNILPDGLGPVRDYLHAWPHHSRNWFCLILPLRRLAALAGKDPIVSFLPERQHLLPPDLPHRAALYLTLLDSLRSLNVWSADSSDAVPTLLYTVQMDVEALASQLILSPAIGKQRSLGGLIRYHLPATSGWTSSFTGIETISAHPAFGQLQTTAPDWPTTMTINAQGKSVSVRDKAIPHAAVVFQRGPSCPQDHAALRIAWSVFLPLSEEIETLPLSGDEEIHLLLHGYFFLESGRRHLFNEQKDPDAVETRWNRLLKTEEILPQILPTLDRFACETALSYEPLFALTQALASSQMYRRYRTAICTNFHWICCLTTEGPAWQLLPATTPFHAIPALELASMATLLQTLPALANLLSQQAITCRQWPRLSASEPQPWGDNATWMDGLRLDTILTNDDQTDFFCRFVEQEALSFTEGIWQRLVQSLIVAISTLGQEELRQRATAFQRIVRLLPESYWVRLTARAFQAGPGRDMLAGLHRLRISRLVMPDDLAPVGKEGGVLPLEDARTILQGLENDEGLPSPARIRIAAAVLEKTTEDGEARRRQCGELRVFRVYDCRSQQEQPCTWNRLRELRGHGLLFAESEMLMPLQHALRDVRLFRLIGDDATLLPTLLFGMPSLPECRREQCLNALVTRPDLAAPEHRKALLELLARRLREDDVTTRQALRYLLHASSAHYTDESLLLAEASVGVWSKIARMMLAHRGEQWRFVPEVLSGKLTPEQWDALELLKIGALAAEALLRESLDGFDNAAFSGEERQDILLSIGQHNRVLWGRLPLHETVSGRLVPLDAQTFLQSTYPVPPEFAARIVVLPLPKEESLARRYQYHVLEWNEEAALTLALPEALWRVILDALASLTARNAQPALALRGELRKQSWLPVRKGGFCCPEDVIHLPALSDAIARLIVDLRLRGEDVFMDISALHEEVCTHPAMDWLARELFLPPGQALEMLGMSLQEHPAYRIGNIHALQEATDARMEALFLAFAGVEDSLLPGMVLLREAWQHYREIDGHRALLECLRDSLPLTTTKACLVFLSERAETAPRDAKSACREVHDWYLQALLHHPDFRPGVLRGLRLLNRRGHWVASEQLSFDRPNIDGEFLLLEGHSTLLKQRIEDALGEDSANLHTLHGGRAAERKGPAAAVLEEYFRDWEGRVPHEVLGGFLAFLGDEETIQRLARGWLEPKWQSASLRARISRSYGGLEMGGHVTIPFGSWRFACYILPDDASTTVSIRNVLGERFDACKDTTFQSVLVGEVGIDPKQRLCVLPLRKTDTTRLTREQLVRALFEGAALVLHRVYGRVSPDLEPLWRELAESDQMDLEIAQEEILQNIFFYSRQLNECPAGLKELEKQWRDLRYREREQKQWYGGPSKADEVASRRSSLLARLRQMLHEDLQVQSGLHRAVVARVQNYEYRLDSILFELFQNADDAAEELAEMLGPDGTPASARCISIAWDDNSLFLAHWGRPINVFRMGGFLEQQGRDRGFHDDLVKMLILAASDKPEESEHVTGKFGLGFKSAFLFTDTPRVLSGQLGFQVVAGVYPEKLALEDRRRLGERLRLSTGEALAPGTILELPRRPGVTMEAAVTRYRALAPLLMVFSRRIKQCDLRPMNAPIDTLRWRELPLTPHTRRLFHGAPPRGGFGNRWLILRLDEGCSLLLTLGVRGFGTLPDEVPTFWITAPTREELRTGFAVNGPFDPDVGRAQLAFNSEHNPGLARGIGISLREGLMELFDAAEDWNLLRERLDLVADAEHYTFWESLWKLLTPDACRRGETGRNKAAALLHTILWAGDQGMAGFVSSRPVLPTGLSGAYRILTRLSTIRLRVTGALDQVDVFQSVVDWPSFQEHVKAGELVSETLIVARLRDMGMKLPDWKPLGLLDILQWETGEVLLPDQAARLGALVDAAFLAQLAEEERDPLLLYLKALRFKARNDTYVLASELLVAHSGEVSEEERLRVAFAPEDHILHVSYQGNALVFFLVCRQRMEARTELLAEWGLTADTDEKRKAFMLYLAKGELGKRVSDLIRGRKENSWLDGLQHSDYLEGLAEHEKVQVLGATGTTLEDLIPEDVGLDERGPRPEPSPHPDTLERIYDWWHEEAAGQLAQYELDVYPANNGPFVSITPNFRKTPEERQAWLTLLLRGGLETMGRPDWKAHRNFLELCVDRGWFRSFATHSPSPEELVREIERYLDQQLQDIPYFQWVRQVVSLFLFARRLDDYILSLLAANRMSGKIALNSLLCPRINPAFQGGGPDAPPLKDVLGIGAHFVIRELSRKGIVNNTQLHPVCYVPNRRVRLLAARLGGADLLTEENAGRENQARAIHALLVEKLGTERATFAGAFDIPLQLIARDSQLWSDLAGLDEQDWNASESDPGIEG